METARSESVSCPEKRREGEVLVRVSNVLERERAPDANTERYK